MNIMTIAFEEPLVFNIDGKIVQIIAFKTQEQGNVKFGINAPREIGVHREEIYNAIKKKQQNNE